MADGITPVGAMVNPTGQGLQSLSNILGIQQQRQQLQLQAQELQRSQVETQQQTGVNQFFSQWDPGQHLGPDGTIDLNSAHQDPNFQALPGVARIAVDARINALRGQQLDNKMKLSSLNSDVVTQFGKVAQAIAASPDQANQLLQGFSQQGPDQKRIADIYGPMLAQLQQKAPDKISASATALAAQAQDVSAQQQQTNPGQLAVNTGAATQLYNVNKATGLQPGQQPVAAVPNVLGPAQQISYLAGAAGATAGAAARGGGTGNADVDTSNLVTASLRDARANIDLTKRIDQLADIVNPGALPAKVSQGLGALGLQNVNQARTELQKDLGRLRGPLAARSASDSRAGELLSGLPTETTPTQTIHQAMDITRGSARQDLALGKLQANSRQATGGSMSGFQGEYAHAVSSASPLMHEYLALTPAEQVEFFKRNFATREQAAAFRAQANAIKKISPNVIGQ